MTSVIIADDQALVRDGLRLILELAGIEVVGEAVDGAEAVALVRAARPDVALMDIRMPGMDGFEAIADVKATPGLAAIPIVAITADPSEDIVERALAAGCVECLAKPVLPNEVVRCITRVLRLEA